MLLVFYHTFLSDQRVIHTEWGIFLGTTERSVSCVLEDLRIFKQGLRMEPEPGIPNRNPESVKK